MQRKVETEIKNRATIIHTSRFIGLQNETGHHNVTRVGKYFAVDLVFRKKKHRVGTFVTLQEAEEVADTAKKHTEEGDFIEWLDAFKSNRPTRNNHKLH